VAILLVKVADAPVPDSPNKWRAGEIVAAFEDGHVFGNKEIPSAGNFYHVTVTNRTKAQVEAYIERWQHRPTPSVVASQPPNYRIRIESDRASVSGMGDILRPEIEAMLTELGEMVGGSATYHDRGRSGNTIWFEFDVLGVDPEERDMARDFVKDAVSNLSIRRRRWYINGAGMNFLANNGGVASGTAAQIAGFLRDGLED
jgi:hypothetical protein